MKKVLVAVMAMVMLLAVASFAAAEEKDLGMSGNGGVEVSTIKDYDSLVVTVKNESGEGRGGWGIGGLCFEGGWSVDEAFSPKADTFDDGTEMAFTFSVADILAKCEATGDTTVNINYYNDCNIVSVVAVKAGAAETPADETPADETPAETPTDSAAQTGDAMNLVVLFGAAAVAFVAVVASKKARA